jgi:hypothetical protein
MTHRHPIRRSPSRFLYRLAFRLLTTLATLGAGPHAHPPPL